MFFQINVTPKEKKASVPIVENVEPIKNFDLILAPFQPQTRISIETFINITEECFLHVKNTINRSLNVSLTKIPPEERYISLSFTSAVIEANSSTTLKIVWSPREAGSFRDILQLTDSRRIKYEIPLILHAKDPKKKDQKKTRLKTRKPLIPTLATVQSNYLPKNCLTLQKESSTNNKRARPDSYHLQEPNNKENLTNNIDYITDYSNIKKLRTETSTSFTSAIHSETFMHTPVKITTQESEKCWKNSEINIINYDFSPDKENFILTEEHVETKTLRRETYITTPKYRGSSLDIPEITETKNDESDDSLSPQKKKPISDFSFLINNINFTPKIPSTPDDVFYSPRASSTGSKYDGIKRSDSISSGINTNNTTFNISDYEFNKKYSNKANFSLSPTGKKKTNFLKPTCLVQSFDVFTPIAPASQHKMEFASSSLLSFDHSNIETPKRSNSTYRDLDCSSVKEILEADLWVKPKNILPLKSSINGKSQECKKTDEPLSITAGQSNINDETKTQFLEISPPKSIKLKRMSPPKHTRTVNKIRKISPNKSGKIIKNQEFKKKQLEKSLKSTSFSISKAKVANLSLVDIARRKGNQSLKETVGKLHDSNDFVTKFCNPDPFSATTTEDPFLSSTLYYDDKWISLQELEFKKWLNALMTPPEHFTDIETSSIDVGKVWQSCRMKEDVVLAESKESISARYHTNSNLNTLRKAACMMYCSNEVSSILSRGTVCIEKGILVIRQDKDLNRDIGLQKEILELFLSYNPLWLRIGLETVYGETIALQSNNDLIGLTRFLLSRFFSDPFILKTHSHPTVTGMKLASFTPHMNKFMLQKFLFIVYFLDYAKTRKLIGHDPCLFHKKAPYKDSRSILLTFAREVLSGIGDITKVLRSYGYIVSQKQTYLDEFDYAVKDLSSDLRDGVRLCRTIEMIIGKRNLTTCCRVPAISRLQKVHNVNIALSALSNSGYVIIGDIDAKNIADGHREKTLSLLWQIINKFQAPRFNKAASCLQAWWRAKLWYIRVKNFLRRRRDEAASVIQRAYRCRLAKRRLALLRVEHEERMKKRNEAARIIQQAWIIYRERVRQRMEYLKISSAILMIQKWWRNKWTTRPFIENLRKKRQAVIRIQRLWRSIKLKRDKEFCERRLRACRVIQGWWRGVLMMKKIRNDFLLIKYAVRLFEDMWIKKKMLSDERKEFLEKKRCTIVIQRNWRRYQETKVEVSKLQNLKKSSVMIQSWWRSIVIQRQFKMKRESCIKIQKWWRSVQEGKVCRAELLMMKNAALVIQKTWRMTRIKRRYWLVKSAVLCIEMWYESILQTRLIQEEFSKKRKAAVSIQKWWRHKSSGMKVRRDYLKLREIIVSLQVRVRMKQLASRIRQDYLKLREIAIIVQRRWRANKMGLQVRQDFLNYRKNVIFIQVLWRMKLEREKYRKLRAAALQIQRYWRGYFLTRELRLNYLNLRKATVTIQRKWRAERIQREERRNYMKHRQAIVIIQKNWKMQLQRRKYKNMRRACIAIQSRWRGKIETRSKRENFLTLKSIVIMIQRHFRLKRLCRIEREKRENFLAMKIQNWWRAIMKMKRCKNDYLQKRESLIKLQRRYRATVLARKQRREFKESKSMIIKVQAFWRGVLMRRRLEMILTVRLKAVEIIENWWRDILVRREIEKERAIEKMRLGIAAAKIQAAWRGHKIRQAESARMAELRQRTEKAAKQAIPANTLANRLQESINVFLFSNDLGRLSMCLSSLDVITRLSPNGCITVCKVDLVDKIYMTLVRSNRSVPWMDACTRATSILVTLAKYPPTKPYILKVKYIETLARFLTVTVEKEVQLFLHIATLLWVLIDDPGYAQAVLNDSRSIWLLNNLCDTLTKRRHKNALVINQKKEEVMPNSKPDWGLKQKQPRLFSNVLHATTSILKRLAAYEE